MDLSPGASDADVLIVGGGLVGLALARALAPTGLRVALCDRSPLGEAAAIRVAPQGWDTRVFAVSPGSVELLSRLGAWERIPEARVQPIETMRVFGDDGGMVEFSAYDVGERALAWIVENRQLLAALAVGEPGETGQPGTMVLPEAELASLSIEADRVAVGFVDGRGIDARLVVGADGAKSRLRTLAGMSADVRPYGHTSVVANFACASAHNATAWQWFHADGSVLALLPLPGRRVSIVWSVPDRFARELSALGPDALAARVGDASACALGRLVLTEGPATFPLGIVRMDTPCAPRVVLVGDAAHAVHPLAGQGVNLGFGDVAALARVLTERGNVRDPGAEVLLARFARLRAEPVYAMQAVTDGLWRLFGSELPGVRAARNAGMRAVQRIPWIKRALMQPALR